MSENENPLKDIWADDCLDRKKTADFLTNYLEGLYRYAKTKGTNKTFVLNLNARWGFGKTYFMTRWKASLEQAGHPVVYFDAWENDYTADPLLGFISQIDEAVGLIVNKSPKVKRALKSMIKSAAPLLMEIAVKRLTHMSLTEIDELRGGIADEEANRKVGEKVGSSVSKTVEKALKDHKAIRKTIKDFKAKLAALCLQIESQISGKQLPLFIFIDELDRCKPTYALQLLEHIKHLFGVDGVYFVISTDSAQLSESIKAIYGGGFDSHMYLKRFFDQQYLLPDPEGENYAKFLYGKYGLETDINLLSPIDPIFCKNSSPSVQLFVITARAFGASLRTQEQACIALRSIRISMGNNPTHGAYCLFLIFAFIQHPVQFTEYCESCEGSQGLIKAKMRNKQ